LADAQKLRLGTPLCGAVGGPRQQFRTRALEVREDRRAKREGLSDLVRRERYRAPDGARPGLVHEGRVDDALVVRDDVTLREREFERVAL
jgi:hypothetical protein